MSVQNSHIFFDINAHFNSKSQRNLQISEDINKDFESKMKNIQNLKNLIEKPKQNIILFTLMNICAICYVIQDYIMLLQASKTGTIIFVYICQSINAISSIINSCKLVESKKQMFKYFFLLDSICIALIAGMIGFFGISMIFLQPSQYFQLFTLIFLILSFVISTGNYRVTLAKCSWNSKRVIITKINLLFICLGYLFLALYYMKTQTDSPIKADSNSKVQQAKQVFFLYIFGMFSLNLEIYSKITDLDGTGDLKLEYTIINTQEIEITPQKL